MDVKYDIYILVLFLSATITFFGNMAFAVLYLSLMYVFIYSNIEKKFVVVYSELKVEWLISCLLE